MGNTNKRYAVLFALVVAGATFASLTVNSLWWWWPGRKPPVNGELRWDRKCSYGEEFDCGTLYAPLDYTNTNDTRQAKIRVIRYKAGGGDTRRGDVLGSVLMNPGGPGGSGLSFLTRKGLANQTDQVLKGRYDLVSFDPRGVGETWPKVECYESDSDVADLGLVRNAMGMPGQHGDRVMDHEIGSMLADLELVANLCINHEQNRELLTFLSTPFVARDMKLLHTALGDEKLHYWGFSYGTVLGSTYAALFPDDVGRVVLDGVVDVENYYQGMWSDNMLSTETEFGAFFTECVGSGRDRCPLAKLVSGTQLSAQQESLQAVVLDFVNKLKERPLPVPEVHPPRLLTYHDVNSKFFEAMYAPSQWPALAESLFQAIGYGNYSSLLLLQPKKSLNTEALYAISCGDSLSPAAGDGWGINEFKKFWDLSQGQSPNFSIYFANFGAMCHSSWTPRGVERFDKEFNVTTSFPILLLGNDYDPVTPGKYAEKMSRFFKDSVSVRRAGYGHCSSSQPSKCINNFVYEYFVNGLLPPVNSYCPVDAGPFDGAEHVSVSEYLVPI